jgi:hypothetical protein
VPNYIEALKCYGEARGFHRTCALRRRGPIQLIEVPEGTKSLSDSDS